MDLHVRIMLVILRMKQVCRLEDVIWWNILLQRTTIQFVEPSYVSAGYQLDGEKR